MNNLNFDLQLQLVEYLLINNGQELFTIFNLTKDLNPAILYILRKYRKIYDPNINYIMNRYLWFLEYLYKYSSRDWNKVKIRELMPIVNFMFKVKGKYRTKNDALVEAIIYAIDTKDLQGIKHLTNFKNSNPLINFSYVKLREIADALKAANDNDIIDYMTNNNMLRISDDLKIIF